MELNDFVDVYTVVDLTRANSQPKFLSKVNLYFYGDEDVEVDDDEGNWIGSLSKYKEDAFDLTDTIEQFRKDNIIPVSCEKYCYVGPDMPECMGINDGVIVATQDNLAAIYLGTYSEYALDKLIDENAAYTLTEKGLKYLEDLMLGGPDVCPEEREESSTMDNLFGKMGFGKLTNFRFKLSMNGIAVEQGNGKYVVYNKDNNEFVDVTNTLLDIKDALFLLPCVDVAPGDTVLHEDKPYYIVSAGNEIKAVSYEDCTQTVLIPKSTMFGVKYFTKVFSVFGDNFAATGDLFNNPMMLMALMDGKNNDLTQLMLLNSLNNGDLGSNPMALAMLLKGDKSNDSLSTIALMSMFSKGTNPFATKKTNTNTNASE